MTYFIIIIACATVALIAIAGYLVREAADRCEKADLLAEALNVWLRRIEMGDPEDEARRDTKERLSTYLGCGKP